MSEKEPKQTVVKLEEHQFQHLLVILSDINQQLRSIANKQVKLETAIAKVEAELKLIRMEISELKQKK